MAYLKNESSNITIHAMLLGTAGAGKSSLINSLTHLCKSGHGSQKRKYAYVPTASTNIMGGHTMMREPVVLTDTLTIVDNRGWHNWGDEAALRELTAQIRGERTYDDDVSWTETGDTSSATKARVVSDKIDCIAIVINGLGGVDAIENIGKLIDTCRKNIRRKPSFVITHKDKMSSEQIENIRSSLVRKAVESEKIFFIKNVITTTDHLDKESKTRLAAFVEVLVSDGEVGAAGHRRMEGQLITNRKLDLEDKETRNVDGKLDLVREKQIASKIQADTETNRVQQLSKIDISNKQSDGEHTRNVNALQTENVKKLHALKIEHEHDWHAHQKQLQEQRNKDLSKK